MYSIECYEWIVCFIIKKIRIASKGLIIASGCREGICSIVY